MGFLDLGGGLAVNYEGGDTNYDLQEYCDARGFGD